MTGVRIYMEGGGQSKETRGPLRAGMEQFLRDLREGARSRRWSFQVIACCGRSETRGAFENARAQYPEKVTLLLVDAEESVAGSPLQHLQRHWELPGVQENRVHLMAETMEAWIVADAVGLEKFYGQGFLANALPRATNLETVPKADLERALAKATGKTSKCVYHKIQHASQLLERVDPRLARPRCPHCDRMFVEVEALLTQ